MLGDPLDWEEVRQLAAHSDLTSAVCNALSFSESASGRGGRLTVAEDACKQPRERVGVAHVFTIGHSTHSFAALVELLRAHGVTQLADVRSFPGSRRHPHFARAHLEGALPAAAVSYRWLPGLGGRRKLVAGSPTNAAWRVDAFRAYADYMGTPEFETALHELEAWARAAPTAFMCAEAYAARCHRSLLADALVARGWDVLHIESAARARPHRLTPFAHVDAERRVTYPGTPQLPLQASEDG